MTETLARDPSYELLGMEAGQTMLPADDHDGTYTIRTCTHIGGVGLLRTSAFNDREPMSPMGRFGFTKWQQRTHPKRGWIAPDLLVPQLDRIPVEPWATLSDRYIVNGWQRPWPRMDEDWCLPYYDWLPAVEAVAA